MTRTPSTRVQGDALRYALENRVHVDHASFAAVQASVRGSGLGSAHSAPYSVTRVNDTWTCSCPATGTCKHVLAVKVILVLTGQDREQLWQPTAPTADERAASVARGRALLSRFGAHTDFTL